MNELDSLVKNSKLPTQLKEYFTVSKIVKDLITKEVIQEIEDLYIFYKSIYTFDTSEFSAYTITTLKRCNNFNTFYFYLKKVIDTNLELKSRDNLCNEHNSRKIDIILNLYLKNNINEFCYFIDKIYNSEEGIDLNQTYRLLGRLEMLYLISNNTDCQNILISGKKVLDQYEKKSE